MTPSPGAGMAGEGAPFLAVVPAQEQQLPEPSQPANPEAVGFEEPGSEEIRSEALAAAPPSEAMARIQSKEAGSNAGNETGPMRTKARKAGANARTRARAETGTTGKATARTTGKSKRGQAAGTRSGAAARSKGARRKDQ